MAKPVRDAVMKIVDIAHNGHLPLSEWEMNRILNLVIQYKVFISNAYCIHKLITANLLHLGPLLAARVCGSTSAFCADQCGVLLVETVNSMWRDWGERNRLPPPSNDTLCSAGMRGSMMKAMVLLEANLQDFVLDPHSFGDSCEATGYSLFRALQRDFFEGKEAISPLVLEEMSSYSEQAVSWANKEIVPLAVDASDTILDAH